MTHVPFPWGLLVLDVGGTIVSTGAALAATDETTAISCGFIACLFLAVTVLQIAAWGWFEHRHHRVLARKARAHREWERAKADLEASSRELARTIGRQMAEAMRGRAP